MTRMTEQELDAMEQDEAKRKIRSLEELVAHWEQVVGARSNVMTKQDEEMIAFATRLLGCHLSNKARELTVAFLVNSRSNRNFNYKGGES